MQRSSARESGTSSRRIRHARGRVGAEWLVQVTDLRSCVRRTKTAARTSSDFGRQLAQRVERDSSLCHCAGEGLEVLHVGRSDV